MYQLDLGLNNLQWLICYKTKANTVTATNLSMGRVDSSIG